MAFGAGAWVELLNARANPCARGTAKLVAWRKRWMEAHGISWLPARGREPLYIVELPNSEQVQDSSDVV